MFKNKKVSLIIVSALALTLAFGLMAFTSANAAGPDNNGGPGRPRSPRNGFGGDEYLADALGISEADLQAAYETAQATGLEQAVAEGLITQEQAEQMAGRGFFGRRGFGGPDGTIDFEGLLADALGISVEELAAAREAAKDAAIEQALADGNITEEQVELIEAREALRNYIEKNEILAKALGITVEELDAAQEGGQRIPDLLEELGIEQEDFEAAMQETHQEILDQAVEDGVITQEQADQIEENGFKGPKGPGGRGGQGGQTGGPGNRVPGDKPEGAPERPGFPDGPGGQQLPPGNES